VDQPGEKTGKLVSVSGAQPLFLLRGVAAARSSPSLAGKPSRFEISDGSRTRVLNDWPDGFLDQMCSLRWADDLDGDGRLDLYMSLSNHYNVTEHTLLLSSHAKDGQVVGVAAVWRTTGC
jgi:hypothetical protein